MAFLHHTSAEVSFFEVTGLGLMNKNIVGIILIILAVLAVWWGWGKMQPYLNTGGDAPIEETTGTPEMVI